MAEEKGILLFSPPFLDVSFVSAAAEGKGEKVGILTRVSLTNYYSLLLPSLEMVAKRKIPFSFPPFPLSYVLLARLLLRMYFGNSCNSD